MKKKKRKFVWKDDFSVGNTEIDIQHQKLIQLINRLDDGLFEGLSHTALSKILNQLVEYAEIHFSCEEELMEMNDYPDLENHKAGHQAFLDTIYGFMARFEAGDRVLGRSIYDFLRVWLSSHILAQDKMYEPYIQRDSETAMSLMA